MSYCTRWLQPGSCRHTRRSQMTQLCGTGHQCFQQQVFHSNAPSHWVHCGHAKPMPLLYAMKEGLSLLDSSHITARPVLTAQARRVAAAQSRLRAMGQALLACHVGSTEHTRQEPTGSRGKRHYSTSVQNNHDRTLTAQHSMLTAQQRPLQAGVQSFGGRTQRQERVCCSCQCVCRCRTAAQAALVAAAALVCWQLKGLWEAAQLQVWTCLVRWQVPQEGVGVGVGE
jgi:hypothetical protein